MGDPVLNLGAVRLSEAYLDKTKNLSATDKKQLDHVLEQIASVDGSGQVLSGADIRGLAGVFGSDQYLSVADLQTAGIEGAASLLESALDIIQSFGGGQRLAELNKDREIVTRGGVPKWQSAKGAPRTITRNFLAGLTRGNPSGDVAPDLKVEIRDLDTQTLSRLSSLIRRDPELRNMLKNFSSMPTNERIANLSVKQKIWAGGLHSQINRLDPVSRQSLLTQFSLHQAREDLSDKIKTGEMTSFPGFQHLTRDSSTDLHTTIVDKPNSAWGSPAWARQLPREGLQSLRGEMQNLASKQGLDLETYLKDVVLKDPNLPPNCRLQCARAVYGLVGEGAKLTLLHASNPNAEPQAIIAANAKILEAVNDGKQALQGLVEQEAQKALDLIAPGFVVPEIGTMGAGIGQFTAGFITDNANTLSDYNIPYLNNWVALFDMDYGAMLAGEAQQFATKMEKTFVVDSQKIEGFISLDGAESSFGNGGYLSIRVGEQQYKLPFGVDGSFLQGQMAGAGGMQVTVDNKTGKVSIEVPADMVGQELQLTLSDQERKMPGRGAQMIHDEIALNYFLSGITERQEKVDVDLNVKDNYDTDQIWNDEPLQFAEAAAESLQIMQSRIQQHLQRYNARPEVQLTLVGEGEVWVEPDGSLTYGGVNADGSFGEVANSADLENARFSMVNADYDGNVGILKLEVHAHASGAASGAHNANLSAGRAYSQAIKFLAEVGYGEAEIEAIMQGATATVGHGGKNSYTYATYQESR